MKWVVHYPGRAHWVIRDGPFPRAWREDDHGVPPDEARPLALVRLKGEPRFEDGEHVELAE